MFNPEPIITAVQNNCDIADARHAREMGMCNYLLARRDFYRWELGVPLGHQMKKSDIGNWLSQRETRWNEIENDDYRSIQIDGQDHDPFDYALINLKLADHGLAYGSGYGYWGKPQFFLANLVSCEHRSGLEIFKAGQEFARNIAAPPAAQNHNTIFIRMDIMQRWLFGKVEIWGTNKTESALKSMLDCYGVSESVESKLAMIAEHESETLILHEVGEAMATPLLGDVWNEMLSSFNLRRCELISRAVRDNLADCLSTLPELISRGESCSLHFYFSNFEGMRQSLFPTLSLAYKHWISSGDFTLLLNAVASGREYWLKAAKELLNTWVNNPANAEAMIANESAIQYKL